MSVLNSCVPRCQESPRLVLYSFRNKRQTSRATRKNERSHKTIVVGLKGVLSWNDEVRCLDLPDQVEIETALVHWSDLVYSECGDHYR